MNQTTISFQTFTRLPIQEILKADSTSVAIQIKTPMGLKILDYKYVSTPFFGASRDVEHPASRIISRLQELERESLDYLLEQWLNK